MCGVALETVWSPPCTFIWNARAVWFQPQLARMLNLLVAGVLDAPTMLSAVAMLDVSTGVNTVPLYVTAVGPDVSTVARIHRFSRIGSSPRTRVTMYGSSPVSP